MSYFAVLCVVLFCSSQGFSAELPDDMYDKNALKCMEEAKVDKKFVESFFDAEFHLPKGVPELNTLFECVVKAKGIIDENGKINKELLHNDICTILLPWLNKTGDIHEMGNKIIAECQEVKGDTVGEHVVNLHNCIVNSARKL